MSKHRYCRVEPLLALLDDWVKQKNKALADRRDVEKNVLYQCVIDLRDVVDRETIPELDPAQIARGEAEVAAGESDPVADFAERVHPHLRGEALAQLKKSGGSGADGL